MDDAKLKALLAANMPPARDPHFVMAVMRRAEQRRFRRELARILGLCAAIVLLLALVMPKLDIGWLAELSPTNDMALAAGLMIVTVLWPRIFARQDD